MSVQGQAAAVSAWTQPKTTELPPATLRQSVSQLPVHGERWTRQSIIAMQGTARDIVFSTQVAHVRAPET